MFGNVAGTLGALAMVVTANAALGPAIQAGRISTEEEEELGLFPSGLLVGPASCGFDNMVADLLWVRAIQYYGKHKQGDLIFDKTEHVFDVLTDLDPGFSEAYRFGSLVLVEDAFAKEEGFRLLRKGIRNNPRDGSLYFDLGFHHFKAKEYDKAAVYFERAARLPGGSDKAARFAAYAQNRQGRLDASEEMWLEILKTTSNDKTRASAEFALRSIAAARDTAFLAERCRTFRERYGVFPGSADDLVSARLISSMPDDPFDTHYVLQPFTGEVRSWHLLSRELKRDVGVLEGIIRRYEADGRGIPRDLEELQRNGYLEKIPAPFGVTYNVDQERGKVKIEFPSRRAHGGSG